MGRLEFLGVTYHPDRSSSGTPEVGLRWASGSLCIVPTTPAAARHPTATRSEQPRWGMMDSLGNFHASVDRF